MLPMYPAAPVTRMFKEAISRAEKNYKGSRSNGSRSGENCQRGMG
jgi:hypothetical protein